ncbi:peptidylprolyl isomerase [Nocardia sp. CDC159]|uniref:Peptidyl-prolyl cis-trans isomerase n=1 Tax=Nocardia pulmonis TaxID=2951408 RepID=A0A9X2E5I1_9NOCA|nr:MULTISPECIES: peptidylprolyl isomerase [Nocardia]MCM6774702.1 peptidylprolyl isomerase [Nocardia pulmonis]MCM6787233.1 peptidylprolyl isomerase [Nocardia sp. CDC159]
MPSNEQRRAAAKRKLERRLARQAERARRRKQLTIAGSVLGVVVVVAAGVGIYYLTRGDEDAKNTASQASDSSLASTPEAAPPPAPQPKATTVSCTYRDGGGPAAKPVQKPNGDNIVAKGQEAVTITTNHGPIGLTLDRAESPCTVNSFASLVSQHYYDGAPCHRLSTKGLKMLQCGDPTGTGKGGPGYVYDNEYPTDVYAQDDPNAQMPVLYKRGTIAMANAGPGTNGSQFFLLYGDSQLPPQYTIFGTVDEAGLKTLDKIAEIGDDGSMDSGPGGGKPNQPVTFESVKIG